MKVLINGETPVAGLNAIPTPVVSPEQNPYTEYFDIPSGKKTFTVFDEGGNLIFSKEIELISWERITIVFSGFYSTDELQNTFGNFEFNEGEVYISRQPVSGASHMYFIHASGPVGDTDSRTYDQISASYIPAGQTEAIDTVFNVPDLAYGNVASIGNLPAGEYTFTLSAEAGNFIYETTVAPGLLYYMFIYDSPDNIKIYKNEVAIPPARQRD